MNEDVIQEGLWGLLIREWGFEDTALAEVEDVKTFQQAGLLTRDKGIVITMRDGSQFNITITQTAKYKEGYYENL